MASMVIRNIPDDVLAKLKEKARSEGKSTEQFAREATGGEGKADLATNSCAAWMKSGAARSLSTWRPRCESWRRLALNEMHGPSSRTCQMIVDANVAIYWCVETPLTNAAKPVAQRTDLCAPHLIKLETANALLKYLRAGLITNRQFHDSFDIVRGCDCRVRRRFEPASELPPKSPSRTLTRSTIVFISLSHSQRREPIATADRRLAAIAQRSASKLTWSKPS